MNFRTLGNKVTQFKQFEVFPRPHNIAVVTMESDEVTANCPVTGAPDWYKVTITYYPKTACIESKTMKLYLQSFRNKGLFCEAFASRIVDDIHNAIKCPVSVSVVQKPRGGVGIIATARKEVMS